MKKTLSFLIIQSFFTSSLLIKSAASNIASPNSNTSFVNLTTNSDDKMIAQLLSECTRSYNQTAFLLRISILERKIHILELREIAIKNNKIKDFLFYTEMLQTSMSSSNKQFSKLKMLEDLKAKLKYLKTELKSLKINPMSEDSFFRNLVEIEKRIEQLEQRDVIIKFLKEN